MFPLKFVILGLGEVGTSLLSLLHRQEAAGMLPRGILEIAGIADSKGFLYSQSGLSLTEVLEAKQADKLCSKDGYVGGGTALELVRNSEADIVIDCMPTNYADGEPTNQCIRSAMQNHMHYVTASKGAMALHMVELLELSRKHGTRLKFGATVGGGTPFLDFGRDCLYPQKITSLRGVLNGTTNFVLTGMEKGKSIQSVLDEAGKLGYAEADPSNDIRGFDTAAKLVILANWVMGREINLSDVGITGIGGLTAADTDAARRHGKVIRLIGSVTEKAIVKPEEIEVEDVLNVQGSLNALTYYTEFAGPVTLTGAGAGGASTAQAMLRDILSILRDAVDSRKAVES